MKKKIVLTDEYFEVVPPESSPEMKQGFISYNLQSSDPRLIIVTFVRNKSCFSIV